ncbi:MAG TPA: hypothetical protein DCQ64_03310 [Candidatus Rokubacteria bacterium]|nr:MAG: hypothetical protein A2X53_01975 [Candidatus Rokubacteria bacterium GWA2_70_23]OGK91322.1 MAG: hypothetical protein A2X50_04365 [Candidatus Rokubacteria bacterium GWF2_70_14]HAM54471.1 hypothetical protein [Candidatus Rokubacteria bacterium]
MQDRPTIPEALQAARDFLAQDLLPTVTDPRLRYHLQIAVNVLRIVEREAPGEEERLRAEHAALRDLLGQPPASPPEDAAALRRAVLEANHALSERIRQGDADGGPWRLRVLAHVAAAVDDKLAVNNPAQLAAFRAEAGAESPGD